MIVIECLRTCELRSTMGRDKDWCEADFVYRNTELKSHGNVRYWLDKAVSHGVVERRWASWPTGCFARYEFRLIDKSLFAQVSHQDLNDIQHKNGDFENTDVSWLSQQNV
jgi:hypothetical protein